MTLSSPLVKAPRRVRHSEEAKGQCGELRI